jgi:uncharacterized protein YcgI (DUF1989 family)
MTGKKTYGVVRLTVPGGYGRAIDVAKGQYVAVRDIEGGQCGDFWAIDADDPDHFLAPSYTWVHLGRIQPRVGDELVTNRREPILTIIADDVGWHDMLVPACDKQRYAKYYGVTEHRSCHDNFLEAMSGRHWGKRPVPQPFNLFMNTFVEPDGTMHIRDPISKAGDKILMLARMSVIIVVSACPMDLNPVGGQGITDLEILIGDTEEEILAVIQNDR